MLMKKAYMITAGRDGSGVDVDGGECVHGRAASKKAFI